MYIPFLVRSFRIRCLIFCSVLSVVDSLDKCGSRDVVIEMPLTVSSALWLIFLAAYFKESVRSLTWLLIRSVVLFVLSWRVGFASYATAGLNNEAVGWIYYHFFPVGNIQISGTTVSRPWWWKGGGWFCPVADLSRTESRTESIATANYTIVWIT